MRFAPSGSNCGAATAARFLHLFKFGLVVFRRVTFGDGRQSRRLPAAFLYRPGRTQRPDARRQAMRRPNAKADARRQTMLRPNAKAEPEGKPHAERSPRPAPLRTVPPRSGRRRTGQPGAAQSRFAPYGCKHRHRGRICTSVPPRTRKKRSTPRVLHAICTSSSRLRLKQPQRGFFIY